MRSICAAIALAWLVLAQAASADTQSHRLAAWKLLQAMHFDTLFEQTVTQLVDFELDQHPDWTPYAPAVHKFFTETLDRQALKEALIGIYTARFSEQELDDITAFYSSPTGQKLLQQTPDLVMDIAQVARQQISAQESQLRQALEAAIRDAGKYQMSPAS